MAELWGGFLVGTYGLAGRLMIPAFPAMLRARARRGREDPLRLRERYGHPSAARPPGRLVWVHAASVGETNAIAPLVQRLAAAGWPVLVTTITVTGAATARRALPEILHQFAPLDVAPWVERFLDHWRPTAAIFVKSETWPVITDRLVARRVPHIIVNARMSERSFRRWRSLGSAPRRIFGRIDMAFAQSAADATRLDALGVRRVDVLGNLKFDAPPPGASAEAVRLLHADIAGRPFWLAASTHPGEEEIAAAAHAIVARERPDLITAIVPRHPDRGPAIRDGLAASGARVGLRSRNKSIPDDGGILVADTLGELGLFYRAAPVSFVGGSLAERGGQNPIEPIRLGSAVMHGPNTANFAEVYGAVDAAGGAVRVANASTLATSVLALLRDEDARRRQLAAAERALEPFAGALDRTVSALDPFLTGAAAAAW